MVAMLIGCGRRRDELLALNLESVQQRQEEHWVIADLVGKGREEPGCLRGGPQGRRSPRLHAQNRPKGESRAR
jgi:hypothetical protein